MKKIATILVAVAALGMAVPAQAGLKWGVKAGMNYSKASLSGEHYKMKNSTGYFFGPMADISIPVVGLGLDGALLYSHKGAIKSDEGETGKMNSIEIPINLKYNIGLGSVAGLYIAAGPQFGWNIGKKNYEIGDEGGYKLKSSNLSLNVGAGVKLLGHLQAGINYNIALGKTGDGIGDNVKEFDFKTNTWQVSVAYMF